MEEKVSFSKEAQAELSGMLDAVIKITTYSLDMFSNNNRIHMQEILELEDNIDKMERELQQNHVQRLTRGECTPNAGMLYSDIVSGLERVADHATNICFFYPGGGSGGRHERCCSGINIENPAYTYHIAGIFLSFCPDGMLLTFCTCMVQ